MAPTARLPPKKDVALALLERASMYIHLDPRPDAVKVPVAFKKQAELVLQVGLNMAVPIPDLRVDEQGLSCTLSFNRSPFWCMIPWPAVFALVGEHGQAVVWAEDVPAEVNAQAQARRAPEKPRNHLRTVGEGEGVPAPVAAAEPTKIPEKKPATKVGKPAARAGAVAEPRAKRAAHAAGKRSIEPKVAAKAAPKKATKLASEVKSKAAVQPVAAAAPAVVSKKSVQQAPAAARPGAEVGKKRELPPYLRVVK